MTTKQTNGTWATTDPIFDGALFGLAFLVSQRHNKPDAYVKVMTQGNDLVMMATNGPSFVEARVYTPNHLPKLDALFSPASLGGCGTGGAFRVAASGLHYNYCPVADGAWHGKINHIKPEKRDPKFPEAARYLEFGPLLKPVSEPPTTWISRLDVMSPVLEKVMPMLRANELLVRDPKDTHLDSRTSLTWRMASFRGELSLLFCSNVPTTKDQLLTRPFIRVRGLILGVQKR